MRLGSVVSYAALLGDVRVPTPNGPLLAARTEPTSHVRPAELVADAKLAVIGDVQRTSWAERCLLCRELNDEPQRRLRDDLGRREFGALVLLGDMAFSGSDEDWAHFDAWLAPLLVSRPGIPLVPVMGNHDYYQDAARQVQRRFPDLDGSEGASRYAVRWGAVRLLVLDGNRRNIEGSSRCVRSVGRARRSRATTAGSASSHGCGESSLKSTPRRTSAERSCSFISRRTPRAPGSKPISTTRASWPRSCS